MGAPMRCTWLEDPDGSRHLIPGCWTRINDPDIDECDCQMLEQELAKARAELEAARRAYRSLQGWHDQVVRAVHDHPDGKKIMYAASLEGAA